jgi:hypothetical protein
VGRFRTFRFDTLTVGWHREPTYTSHTVRADACSNRTATRRAARYARPTIIQKSVGTEFADRMTDDHETMGLEACVQTRSCDQVGAAMSQLVRAIQLAERQSTHLAAARSYPVADGFTSCSETERDQIECDVRV